MLEKSSVLKFGTTALAAVVMVGGSIAAQPISAQAATYYHRTKTAKVSKAAYYSTSSAKTYKFVGTTKKFKFKSNHNLANYKKTTWTRSSKTYVTKHGKKYLYYYVTNSKNGAKGWVWHKYLKAGRNYQMTAAKKMTATNYVQAKSGKVYQLNTDLNNAVFSKGVKLSKTATYEATQQRSFYKKGKTYKYYYVTGTNGTEGWVWSNYLKAGTYTAPTDKPATTEPTEPNTDTTKPYDGTVVVKAVTQTINETRKANGEAELTNDATLQHMAETRALQLKADSKVTVNDLAKSIGIGDYFTGEVTTNGGFVASDDANASLLTDNLRRSSADWATLTDKTNTKVGITAYKQAGNLYLVIELGKDQVVTPAVTK